MQNEYETLKRRLKKTEDETKAQYKQILELQLEIKRYKEKNIQLHNTILSKNKEIRQQNRQHQKLIKHLDYVEWYCHRQYDDVCHLIDENEYLKDGLSYYRTKERHRLHQSIIEHQSCSTALAGGDQLHISSEKQKDNFNNSMETNLDNLSSGPAKTQNINPNLLTSGESPPQTNHNFEPVSENLNQSTVSTSTPPNQSFQPALTTQQQQLAPSISAHCQPEPPAPSNATAHQCHDQMAISISTLNNEPSSHKSNRCSSQPQPVNTTAEIHATTQPLPLNTTENAALNALISTPINPHKPSIISTALSNQMEAPVVNSDFKKKNLCVIPNNEQQTSVFTPNNLPRSSASISSPTFTNELTIASNAITPNSVHQPSTSKLCPNVTPKATATVLTPKNMQRPLNPTTFPPNIQNSPCTILTTHNPNNATHSNSSQSFSVLHPTISQPPPVTDFPSGSNHAPAVPFFIPNDSGTLQQQPFEPDFPVSTPTTPNQPLEAALNTHQRQKQLAPSISTHCQQEPPAPSNTTHHQCHDQMAISIFTSNNELSSYTPNRCASQLQPTNATPEQHATVQSLPHNTIENAELYTPTLTSIKAQQPSSISTAPSNQIEAPVVTPVSKYQNLNVFPNNEQQTYIFTPNDLPSSSASTSSPTFTNELTIATDPIIPNSVHQPSYSKLCPNVTPKATATAFTSKNTQRPLNPTTFPPNIQNSPSTIVTTHDPNDQTPAKSAPSFSVLHPTIPQPPPVTDFPSGSNHAPAVPFFIPNDSGTLQQQPFEPDFPVSTPTTPNQPLEAALNTHQRQKQLAPSISTHCQQEPPAPSNTTGHQCHDQMIVSIATSNNELSSHKLNRCHSQLQPTSTTAETHATTQLLPLSNTINAELSAPTLTPIRAQKPSSIFGVPSNQLEAPVVTPVSKNQNLNVFPNNEQQTYIFTPNDLPSSSASISSPTFTNELTIATDPIIPNSVHQPSYSKLCPIVTPKATATALTPKNTQRPLNPTTFPPNIQNSPSTILTTHDPNDQTPAKCTPSFSVLHPTISQPPPVTDFPSGSNHAPAVPFFIPNDSGTLQQQPFEPDFPVSTPTTPNQPLEAALNTHQRQKQLAPSISTHCQQEPPAPSNTTGHQCHDQMAISIATSNNELSSHKLNRCHSQLQPTSTTAETHATTQLLPLSNTINAELSAPTLTSIKAQQPSSIFGVPSNHLEAPVVTPVSKYQNLNVFPNNEQQTYIFTPNDLPSSSASTSSPTVTNEIKIASNPNTRNNVGLFQPSTSKVCPNVTPKATATALTSKNMQRSLNATTFPPNIQNSPCTILTPHNPNDQTPAKSAPSFSVLHPTIPQPPPVTDFPSGSNHAPAVPFFIPNDSGTLQQQPFEPDFPVSTPTTPNQPLEAALNMHQRQKQLAPSISTHCQQEPPAPSNTTGHQCHDQMAISIATSNNELSSHKLNRCHSQLQPTSTTAETHATTQLLPLSNTINTELSAPTLTPIRAQKPSSIFGVPSNQLEAPVVTPVSKYQNLNVFPNNEQQTYIFTPNNLPRSSASTSSPTVTNEIKIASNPITRNNVGLFQPSTSKVCPNVTPKATTTVFTPKNMQRPLNATTFPPNIQNSPCTILTPHNPNDQTPAKCTPSFSVLNPTIPQPLLATNLPPGSNHAPVPFFIPNDSGTLQQQPFGPHFQPRPTDRNAVTCNPFQPIAPSQPAANATKLDIETSSQSSSDCSWSTSESQTASSCTGSSRTALLDQKPEDHVSIHTQDNESIIQTSKPTSSFKSIFYYEKQHSQNFATKEKHNTFANFDKNMQKRNSEAYYRIGEDLV